MKLNKKYSKASDMQDGYKKDCKSKGKRNMKKSYKGK